MVTGPPATPTPRRILLADADAFYVAVARLVDPEGAGREPLLIVGGAADHRGVVTSASYEAREFGVRSAMPTAHALRLCPNAKVVPVPRKACVQRSRAILRVLERFTPAVEAASIDEFYLDLSGTEGLYRGEALAQTAARIRGAVLQETGLSVSIGGGTSKLVAKLAAKDAKPRPGRRGSGVHVVPPGGEAAFIERLALADIPMVGPRFQERLARYGLHTVRDALRHDEATLAAWLGRRAGRWLHQRIRGLDATPVVGWRGAKTVGHEETFATDIDADADLERELLRLALNVARDLRSKGLRGRTVTVKIRDADFTTRQASGTLAEAVSADQLIVERARALLRRLRRIRRTPARLLGVAMSQLSAGDEHPGQLSLFDAGGPSGIETDRDRALSRVVDHIAGRYGRESIVRASEVKGA